MEGQVIFIWLFVVTFSFSFAKDEIEAGNYLLALLITLRSRATSWERRENIGKGEIAVELTLSNGKRFLDTMIEDIF